MKTAIILIILKLPLTSLAQNEAGNNIPNAVVQTLVGLLHIAKEDIFGHTHFERRISNFKPKK